MGEEDDKAMARRLVRRAAEASSTSDRDALLRRAARLVGSAEQRRLWRRYRPEDAED